MNPMMALAELSPKLQLLLPEMVIFVGAVIVAIRGLSRSRSARESLPLLTCITLLASIAVVPLAWSADGSADTGLLLPRLGRFVDPMIAGVAVLLTLLGIGTVDRRIEATFACGRGTFDPQRVIRGEFYAFFLFSVMGAMLLANATDLIWLFLAIELVSLPTYIMVAIGGQGTRPHEASVKYFFLGAMSTAIFLYGFALLYWSTGSLELIAIRDALAAQSATTGISTVATIGLVMAILGLCFKITAVPMHFYAPDVYEGAPTHVAAFLAFIPKAAGFVALVLLLTCVGWSGHSFLDADGVRIAYDGLPTPIAAILWMVAVITMTLGNVGGLLQTSVKRTLAYSSIAHSGYMVIGLVAGSAAGIDAILLYLLAYGVMTTAAFAALSALERKGEELNSFADISGMRVKHPLMAWMLALSQASLVGMPPFIGFVAKVYLFIAAFEAAQFSLVVVAVLNSAVSALYYLRIAIMPLVAPPSARSDEVTVVPSAWPRFAAVVCGTATLVMSVFAGSILSAARESTSQTKAVATAMDAPKHP
ncbi:MAG: NADH-quinone oxidoreductase subunit N [Phycisphaerales bacterium]|nr:NADH-quinone oxidoreductase subunit N [Phycisphaerales bacterium]